jgi:hypothetical protein
MADPRADRPGTVSAVDASDLSVPQPPAIRDPASSFSTRTHRKKVAPWAGREKIFRDGCVFIGPMSNVSVYIRRDIHDSERAP